MLDLFSKRKKEPQDTAAEDEFKSYVDEADSNGTIRENEAEMIRNILEFRDTDARDVMTHRNDIVAIDGSMPLKDAVPEILNGSNSRYPVYDGNIDTILGILTFRDAMRVYLKNPEMRDVPVSDVPHLVREATIYPETRPIGRILDYMRSQKIQMVIIVDEYGQTSGLIAMEDILEEIVGSILDEYDHDEHEAASRSGGSYVMDGMISLEEAGDVLGCDFSGEDFETLSGYLTARLGHIPGPDDKTVTGNHFLFHILKTENHTIRKVRAERLPEKKGEGTCQDIQSSQT